MSTQFNHTIQVRNDPPFSHEVVSALALALSRSSMGSGLRSVCWYLYSLLSFAAATDPQES